MNDEMVRDVVDVAGYAIGYWASKAELNGGIDTFTTYTVTEAETGDEFVLTFQKIRSARARLLDGRIPVGAYIKAMLVNNDDAGDIDGEAADYIIQAAAFGEVVYG
jgi:hypothetical protein